MAISSIFNIAWHNLISVCLSFNKVISDLFLDILEDKIASVHLYNNNYKIKHCLTLAKDFYWEHLEQEHWSYHAQ